MNSEHTIAETGRVLAAQLGGVFTVSARKLRDYRTRKQGAQNKSA